MKEKIKLIVLVIVFVVLLVVVNILLNNNNNDNNLVQSDLKNEVNNTVSGEENITTSVVASYNENTAAGFYANVVEEEKTGEVFEVSEENFVEMVLKSKKKVLVEFYADWCGPCKTLSPILEEIAKENLDIKVVKINVDENPNLTLDYGANYIPLLVVVENGNITNHAVGALPKKDILELVK